MDDSSGMLMLSLTEMRERVGTEVGVSRWFDIPQERIDSFASLTEDHQFIHVDPERVKAETEMGGTIAHGFLTLSLLSAMALDATPTFEGVRMGVNYGFDKVRFLAPVRSGSRIRGRFLLGLLEERRKGEVDVIWSVTVEADGEKRPVLSAQWINRMYLEEAG